MADDISIVAKQNAMVQTLLSLVYNPGKTVIDACEENGITERQYRYWVQNSPETVNVLRELIGQIQINELTNITVARKRMVDRMIELAEKETTSPKMLLNIYKVINQLYETEQDFLHARPGIEEEAQAFLKSGPKIETKQSRFASINIEETEKGFTVDLYKDKEIVEGVSLSEKDSTDETSTPPVES